MPRAKWKTNLVNAFPIPDDRKPKKPTTSADTPDPDDTSNDNTFKPQGIFPFLHLPSELRNRIYNLILFSDPNPTTNNSNDPLHSREILPCINNLSFLHLNKRIHSETTHLLYSTATIRLFPLQDFLSVPALKDLAPHYRTHITRLCLTLGSSWTGPPASWTVTKGLARCLGRVRGVRTLKVFVTLDPSEPMFEKYRVSHEYYTDFCGGLLTDVLKAMPKGLEAVELAGYRHVEPDGPLVRRLRVEVEASGKVVRWGRECGWEEKMLATEMGRLAVR